ncbi:MAG: hypothetical protein ACFFD2_25190, partial [Promethearchaeota archaeon]
MRNRNKVFSIGLFILIISVLFINGFIMIKLNTIINGPPSGLNGCPYTFENADMTYIVYGPPTALTVTKSESVSIGLYPNGTIKSERVTVSFVFENDDDENCSFDLIDRAENCDLDTIKFQKGTFIRILEYEIIKNDSEFGITIIKWSNITVKANSRAKYGYSIESYRQVPLEIETKYYVNESLVEINPTKNALNASIGSRVTNIIRVHNIQQDLFSTFDTLKPTTICLVTLLLPFEEDEEKRDFDEPIFNPAPLTVNVIAPIEQVSWLALGDVYEINWSTVIRKGGGWGIIELQPLRFDIIQSADLTDILFDGLSSLLGVVAAQQMYWAALTLMTMIEEMMSLVGIFEMLLNDIQTQLGMLSMINFSLINCLLISLIELDMTHSSLEEIYIVLNDMYDDIESQFGILNPITEEFRQILGIGFEGIITNGPIGIEYIISGYMSIPLLLDYYEDIERRIIGSFGASMIELLGSPAIINLSSTVDDFQLLINATASKLPDNSTDFYTFIDITNLTLPIAFGYSLNLTQRYEFQLNIPYEREIFGYIDALFGSPVIPFDLFPIIPGSPESNIPGTYTWMLNILQIGKTALWTTIGNLTRSLSTLMLLLDSSFSEETLQLLNSVLTDFGVFDFSTPITLETGFQGLSDLTGLLSRIKEQFNS